MEKRKGPNKYADNSIRLFSAWVAKFIFFLVLTKLTYQITKQQ